MSNLKTALLTAVALISTVGIAHAQAGLNDLEIAHAAYTADVIDIEYANIALAKTKNPEVRGFAELMIRDHTAVNEGAAALLAKLKVKPVDNAFSQALIAGATAKKAAAQCSRRHGVRSRLRRQRAGLPPGREQDCRRDLDPHCPEWRGQGVPDPGARHFPHSRRPRRPHGRCAEVARTRPRKGEKCSTGVNSCWRWRLGLTPHRFAPRRPHREPTRLRSGTSRSSRRGSRCARATPSSGPIGISPRIRRRTTIKGGTPAC